MKYTISEPKSPNLTVHLSSPLGRARTSTRQRRDRNAGIKGKSAVQFNIIYLSLLLKYSKCFLNFEY